MKERGICQEDIIHQGAVDRARQAALPESSYARLAVLYKMLADDTRLKVLWALSQGEMCVCDIAATLGMSKSAISHHLKALRLTDLAAFRREARGGYYFLQDDHVRRLLKVGLDHINESY